MDDYYTKQLKKLHGNVHVKFVSDKGETNFLSLNKNCCQAIAKTISKLADKKQIIVG